MAKKKVQTFDLRKRQSDIDWVRAARHQRHIDLDDEHAKSSKKALKKLEDTRMVVMP